MKPRGPRPGPAARRPRSPHRARSGRRFSPLDRQQQARQRLRRFRQGSMLVVALTALILLLWGIPEPGVAQEPPPQEALELPTDPGEAAAEAAAALRDLLLGFYAMLPRIVIALLCLVLAWLTVRVARSLLLSVLGGWSRVQAISALFAVVVWLLALGAALSVLAGDARALVGSVGLAGLALSWALQAPIESFSGWLLNSFRGYYRIGDRIAVGEVFGDVYRIDVLTTTVWESGGPGHSVAGAQPTGAVITFPNSEVLRANIVNFTRDFPWVWDEVTVGVAEEGDLGLAVRVAEKVAREVVGPAMAEPASTYANLLERAGLGWDVATEPQVFAAPGEYWANLTVRYLVPARERRRWSSALYLALLEALGEQGQRVPPAALRVRTDR